MRVFLIAMLVVLFVVAAICIGLDSTPMLNIDCWRHWIYIPSNAPEKRPESDEAWLTRQCLVEMALVVIRFYDICDESEWDKIHHVSTMHELWALLSKFDGVAPLVASPVDKRYLIDAWRQPYVLDIRIFGAKTVLRITSTGQKPHLSEEITFSPRTNGVSEKRSWESHVQEWRRQEKRK